MDNPNETHPTGRPAAHLSWVSATKVARSHGETLRVEAQSVKESLGLVAQILKSQGFDVGAPHYPVLPWTHRWIDIWTKRGHLVGERRLVEVRSTTRLRNGIMIILGIVPITAGICLGIFMGAWASLVPLLVLSLFAVFMTSAFFGRRFESDLAIVLVDVDATAAEKSTASVDQPIAHILTLAVGRAGTREQHGKHTAWRRIGQFSPEGELTKISLELAASLKAGYSSSLPLT